MGIAILQKRYVEELQDQNNVLLEEDVRKGQRIKEVEYQNSKYKSAFGSF